MTYFNKTPISIRRLRNEFDDRKQASNLIARTGKIRSEWIVRTTITITQIESPYKTRFEPSRQLELCRPTKNVLKSSREKRHNRILPEQRPIRFFQKCTPVS